MHFTDEDFYILDAQGLVIGRNLLPASDIELLRSELMRVSEAANSPKFPIMGTCPLFFDLMTHPWVMEGCERVLGGGFRFDHAFALRQPEGAELANLHGGPQTCQGASFYISGLGASGASWSGRISVGFVVSEQSRKSGGLCYIAGSHKSAFLLHGKDVLTRVLKSEFNSMALSVPTLQPGDIVLFVDSLVHGATPWNNKSPRIALYYMYSPGYMAWRPYAEIEKYAVMARNELERRLLRPPYVAQISESENRWGSNSWRQSVKTTSGS